MPVYFYTSVADTGNITKNINSNKAQGHDNIINRALNLFGENMYLIFKQVLLTGVSPCEWRKRNAIQFNEKRDKQKKLTPIF